MNISDVVSESRFFIRAVGPRRSDQVLATAQSFIISFANEPAFGLSDTGTMPAIQLGILLFNFPSPNATTNYGKMQMEKRFSECGSGECPNQHKTPFGSFSLFEAENNQFRPCQPSRMEICRLPSPMQPLSPHM